MSAVIIIPAYTALHPRLWSAIERAGAPDLVLFPPMIGCSDIPRARSKLITRVLSLDYERVVMIDADVIPTPQQIRALATDPRVDPHTAVTGLYTARDRKGWACFSEVTSAPETDGPSWYPALHAGLGFCCIDKRSLVRLSESLPVVSEGGDWWPFCAPMLVPTGERRAEYLADDYSLWKRLRDTGTALLFRPDLIVGHALDCVVMAPDAPRAVRC